MAKYHQSKSDKLDESLGMRDGAEKYKKQSYKDRRDESKSTHNREMKRSTSEHGSTSEHRSGLMDIKDNTQAGEVRGINTNTEQYDLDRIKPFHVGSKGYSAEAWNYKY